MIAGVVLERGFPNFFSHGGPMPLRFPNFFSHDTPSREVGVYFLGLGLPWLFQVAETRGNPP